MSCRPSFLLEPLTEWINEAGSAIRQLVDDSLGRAEEGEVTEALLPNLPGLVNAELPDNLSIPRPVLAIRLKLDYDMTAAQAAWLAAGLREAETQFSCTVAVKLANMYTRMDEGYAARSDYEDLQKEVRLAAAGSRAEEALLFVRQRLSEFDPKKFDQDGYRLEI